MSVYVRTLTVNDIDKIIELENACFPEAERATLAKFRYRLNVCGELSHGLFTLSKPHPDTPKGVSDFQPKEVLIAMISATKTTSPVITEASMRIPHDLLEKYGAEKPTVTLPVAQPPQTPESQNTPPTSSTEPAADSQASSTTTSSEAAKKPVQESVPAVEGHVEHGETVCIHSLCVDPTYRNNGYSQVLLKDFCQRMKDAGLSKRIALICRKETTGVYTKSQLFRYRGGSNVTHGGVSWVDMVYEYTTPPKGRGSAAKNPSVSRGRTEEAERGPRPLFGTTIGALAQTHPFASILSSYRSELDEGGQIEIPNLDFDED
ncbi:hypothetical protein AOL_s00076g47 [Orbilia oligospora ATCC 24927]|uniref:N-acetyltransferase domain-containing protein n=1 Tax=Arthrobotrys oligospora (strain ATCC 24927 / CBS 115.81 / DSM 1491) TaxID=756982 RepID=G1X8U0_ARTOA|nr:hypothetical protein AOL_s00076g47 [Orbilia oligospora ATCC 24927]EGX50283.1 hypothetical protein AOL_s00076g47 [Orbilia oligospora ATCC 24927]